MKPKSPWFNADCRKAKNDFMKTKRCLSINSSVENKTLFLISRSKFAKTKRHAKMVFYSKEKSKLSDMSKKNPRFGSILKNSKINRVAL